MWLVEETNWCSQTQPIGVYKPNKRRNCNQRRPDSKRKPSSPRWIQRIPKAKRTRKEGHWDSKLCKTINLQWTADQKEPEEVFNESKANKHEKHNRPVDRKPKDFQRSNKRKKTILNEQLPHEGPGQPGAGARNSPRPLYLNQTYQFRGACQKQHWKPQCKADSGKVNFGVEIVGKDLGTSLNGRRRR